MDAKNIGILLMVALNLSDQKQVPRQSRLQGIYCYFHYNTSGNHMPAGHSMIS